MIDCSSIKDIKDNIFNALKNNFSDFLIINEFSKKQFFLVCKQNTICLKINKINLQDVAINDFVDFYSSENTSNSLVGKNCNIDFEILIFTKLDDETDLSDMFLKICSVLSKTENINFDEFLFTKTEFEEKVQAFCTHINVKCNAIISSVYEDSLISDVVVKYKE